MVGIVNVERKEREKMITTKQQQPPIEVKFKKTKKTTTETVIIKMEVQVTESVFGNNKHL